MPQLFFISENDFWYKKLISVIRKSLEFLISENQHDFFILETRISDIRKVIDSLISENYSSLAD